MHFKLIWCDSLTLSSKKLNTSMSKIPTEFLVKIPLWQQNCITSKMRTVQLKTQETGWKSAAINSKTSTRVPQKIPSAFRYRLNNFADCLLIRVMQPKK